MWLGSQVGVALGCLCFLKLTGKLYKSWPLSYYYYYREATIDIGEAMWTHTQVDTVQR